jgi:stage II sporulation protein AB (anti-sigma F factor)
MKKENVQVDTMEFINEMKLCFQARSENESFARVAVAGFLTYLDPTVEELEDIKTAVSEAVTNAIIHGYDEKATSTVYVSCIIYRDGGEHVLQVVIEDTGKGIEDIKQAMEPMFTTRPELERSGMGFTFMNAFMDDVLVQSEIMKGTTVTLFKRLRRLEEHMNEEG